MARAVPIAGAQAKRRFGSARGKIHMADDFDAPLDKISLGKLTLDEPFEGLIPRQLGEHSVEILAIRFAHVAAIARLSLNHRDPFDRMILAQSQVDGFPVVGNDLEWQAYGVRRIW